MNISEQNEKRQELNQGMAENDEFFASFGALDDAVYADGAIPKKSILEITY